MNTSSVMTLEKRKLAAWAAVLEETAQSPGFILLESTQDDASTV